ncbi:hypothetical protein Cni_G21874 [Canna indica]|uniref:C2 domain-containing protein n=1 Tax=Canna indica TaxID=4628 RepID=A0AAQ3KQY3_9LILI|nr:hypothetical protein Cni_G21874 [Canna indica]
MAATTIEITIISAEDLRLGRRPLNRDAFVAVRAGHGRHHEATTNLDGEGGSYPCWNQRFTMTLSPSTRSISVEDKTSIRKNQKYTSQSIAKQSLSIGIEKLWLRSGEDEDRWVWCKSRSGEISVKEAYGYLKYEDEDIDNNCHNWAKVWSKLVPDTKKIVKPSVDSVNSKFREKTQGHEGFNDKLLLYCDVAWTEIIKLVLGILSLSRVKGSF